MPALDAINSLSDFFCFRFFLLSITTQAKFLGMGMHVPCTRQMSEKEGRKIWPKGSIDRQEIDRRSILAVHTYMACMLVN